MENTSSFNRPFEVKNDLRHDEIALMAYTAWQRDGCPGGRDLDYWLEAESQLKATGHLLRVETPPPSANGVRRIGRVARVRKPSSRSRSQA